MSFYVHAFLKVEILCAVVVIRSGCGSADGPLISSWRSAPFSLHLFRMQSQPLIGSKVLPQSFADQRVQVAWDVTLKVVCESVVMKEADSR